MAQDLLAYVSTGDQHQLVWVDRRGVETPISSERGAFRIPRISPEGDRIAVALADERRVSGIWVYDAKRGTRQRATSWDMPALEPVWSADGKVLTMSARGGNIVNVRADGTGEAEVVAKLNHAAYPRDRTADGTLVLLTEDDPVSGHRLSALSRDGKLRTLLAKPGVQFGIASFSPDGKWIVYESEESGSRQVSVASMEALDARIAVSKDGGSAPRWSRDGKEIFYRQGNALMAVAVRLAGGLEIGTPKMLFQGHYSGLGHDVQFDAAPDGQRFAMVKSDEAATLSHITVVQNWQEQLKEQLTAKPQ